MSASSWDDDSKSVEICNKDTGEKHDFAKGPEDIFCA